MKVDMSREAVTSRLKRMEELWTLSMKLMEAGRRSDLRKPTSEKASTEDAKK